jgi:uncharacterized membrane protein
MREMLIQDDIKLVEDRLKEFEANTGCELLLVVADASNPYPGASWRFGLIAGFLISFTFSFYYEFHYGWMWPVSFLVSCLLMTWLGHYKWAKRLALSMWEVDRECQEKAIELFHTLGTSKVTHKVTAMIMVSMLERYIEVLVDEKLRSKMPQSDLDILVKTMQTHFSHGDMGLGLVKSIEKLEEEILTAFNGKVSEVNPSELCDTIRFVNLN